MRPNRCELVDVAGGRRRTQETPDGSATIACLESERTPGVVEFMLWAGCQARRLGVCEGSLGDPAIADLLSDLAQSYAGQTEYEELKAFFAEHTIAI